jgi:hypothetical protein
MEKEARDGFFVDLGAPGGHFWRLFSQNFPDLKRLRKKGHFMTQPLKAHLLFFLIYIYIYIYFNFGARLRRPRGLRGPGAHFAFENTVGSFKIAILARSAPPEPSEGRKCLLGTAGASGKA